jgi:hypothetical protein
MICFFTSYIKRKKNEYGFCVQVPAPTIGNSTTSDVLKNHPKIMYVEHMKLSEFVKIQHKNHSRRQKRKVD